MAMGPAPLPSLGLVLGPGYVLTSDAGTFTHSGQAAAFDMNAPPATSEWPAPLPSMGSLLGLVPARTLVAEAGAFVLDVAPSFSDYAITGQTGDVVLTGQAALLPFGRASLVAAPAAFVLSGQQAALLTINEYRLIAADASFAVSGVSVPFVTARLVQPDVITYSVAGQAATFVRGLSLSAETGAFVMTGQPANLSRAGGVVRYGRRGRRTSGNYPRRTNTVF